MENYIKARDYKILIYAKEDRESYNAAIKALTEAKTMSGWDRVQGVTILKSTALRKITSTEKVENQQNRYTAFFCLTAA